MNPNIIDAGKKTRFKPGQSGNPAGRPRRIPIALTLSLALKLRPQALNRLIGPDLLAHFPEAETDAHALAMFLIIQAANKADPAACREIREILMGKTRHR